MVGGHVGLATQFVSFHFNKAPGIETTQSISDQFSISVPIGIGVHLSPEWVVDFETIFTNDVHPWGVTHFTVDPGIIYTGGPAALGLRVKFDFSANANVGFIPLINKGLVPVGDGMWFIEGALPITMAKGVDGSIGIVLHTGIGF